MIKLAAHEQGQTQEDHHVNSMWSFPNSMHFRTDVDAATANNTTMPPLLRPN